MKKLVLLLLFSWSFCIQAQNNPYCLYDFAGWYRLSTIDIATGTITQIGPIPQVGFYVLGNKQCISTHDSTYVFTGHDGTNARLYTITLDSANLLHDPVFNGVIVGLQYNCDDSTIYAMKENGGAYDLVSVDKTTGLTTQIGSVSAVTAYVGDAFVLDTKRGLYHFFGLFGGQIKMYSINIKTGQVTASPFFPDNVTGLTYNCQDSTIYGVWEDGPDYKLESINPVTGTHSTVGVLANIDPGFVGESASISRSGYYVYRGFSSTNSVLLTIDVQNANVIYNTPFTSNVSGIDHYVCCDEPIVTQIEEVGLNNDFKLYPNPTNNSFIVELQQPMINAELSIFDLTGKQVFNQNNLSGKLIQFKNLELSKGIYMVKLIDENQQYTQKLVVR